MARARKLGDGKYSFEDVMVSLRLLTPVVLMVLSTLTGYLVWKIDENTKSLGEVLTAISSIQAHTKELDRRVTRLEGYKDSELNRLLQRRGGA